MRSPVVDLKGSTDEPETQERCNLTKLVSKIYFFSVILAKPSRYCKIRALHTEADSDQVAYYYVITMTPAVYNESCSARY